MEHLTVVRVSTGSEKRWYVYILQSETTGHTYSGTTTNLVRRVRQHNGEIAGGARATTKGRPWKVLHLEGPMDKVQAHRREYVIKQLPKAMKFALSTP